jgi:hypothetical protein
MRRLLSGTFLVAALLLFAAPNAAAGGGWVVVTVDTLPEGMVAGQETTIGFMARQHGQVPISGQSPKLEFTHQESGQRLTIPATDDGPTGHYVARVTLPQPGTWTWQIDFWAKHPMPPLEVAPAIGQTSAVPAGAVASSVASPLPVSASAPLVVGAITLLVGAALILFRRERGRSPVRA